MLFRSLDNDALYKKENGRWYKKTKDSDYIEIVSGDVSSRIRELETKATPYVSEEDAKNAKIIDPYLDIRNQDVLQPVKQYGEIPKIESFKDKYSDVFPVEKEPETIRLQTHDDGVKTWQKETKKVLNTNIDPKTGEEIGRAHV